MRRTSLTLIVAAAALASVALPVSGQPWYNLQDGTFESRFAIDTDNDLDLDTAGAPASWSSPAGILYGRDHAPDRLAEALLKLIDNRNANGHWTLGFASVTPRVVAVEIRNRDTGHVWHIEAGKIRGVTLWIAYPNGNTNYIDAGLGSSISILDAFDRLGYIPNKHLRRKASLHDGGVPGDPVGGDHESFHVPVESHTSAMELRLHSVLPTILRRLDSTAGESEPNDTQDADARP